MIFYLPFCEQKLEACDYVALTNCLKELARAHIKGHHYIIIDSKYDDWISKQDASNLSKKEIETIKNICRSKSRHQYLAVANVHALISLDNNSFVFDGKIYTISYKSVESFLRQVKFVFENIVNDKNIVLSIFNGIQRLKQEMKGIKIDFDCLHGGGSSIKDVFVHSLDNQFITVALVDSDKSSFCGNFGETASSIQNWWDINRNNHFGNCFVLPCRSIENLIPYCFIKSNNLCPDYPKNILNEFCNFETTIEQEKLIFFPMKMGIDEKSKNSSPEVYDLFFPIGIKKINGFGPIFTSHFSNANIKAKLTSHISEGRWWSYMVDFFEAIMWYCVASNKYII